MNFAEIWCFMTSDDHHVIERLLGTIALGLIIAFALWVVKKLDNGEL